MSVCLSWLTGDFAVLLKAGMSVKQAIVYNLLSALMAYVGMLIGTAVGQYTHNVTSWIFAITAGMFLYVALVDMVSWHAALNSPRVIIVAPPPNMSLTFTVSSPTWTFSPLLSAC